jgi:hypothetical protein
LQTSIIHRACRHVWREERKCLRNARPHHSKALQSDGSVPASAILDVHDCKTRDVEPTVNCAVYSASAPRVFSRPEKRGIPKKGPACSCIYKDWHQHAQRKDELNVVTSV